MRKTPVQVGGSGIAWPTLAEWSRDRDLKNVPEELERKIIAIFPKDTVVHVMVQPSEDSESDEEPQKAITRSLAP